MKKRNHQLLAPSLNRDDYKRNLRKANTGADSFCLIFDSDEWCDEQDRITLLVPARYTLVTCVPQQNGSVQFLNC